MERIKHIFVPTNGIKMHIAEIGSGPAVLFLHGFPEIWYSWRHQMLALAPAGFRAIAPDLRGYGLTENTDPTKLDWTHVADDVVGLLDAIGEEKEPGVPEADFGRFDVATVIKRIYILFCNDEMPIASESEQTLDLVKPSDPLPEWMTEEDLQAYAELYEKSGFQYAMEVPYRSWVRSCEKLSHLQDFTIRAPFLLVLGKRDYVSSMTRMQRFLQSMEAEPDLLPQLKLVCLDEGTHFMQEQLPKQVNQLILDFFTTLQPK